ncbi:DUF7919 family protein [Streptomyces lunaelactis]|uniref:DUF7919 family protein n=1 Tax=Streptomyces lunaelactis TaxID=1535768 RepID=UPI00403A0500
MSFATGWSAWRRSHGKCRDSSDGQWHRVRGPELIAHYVELHDYLPPANFIEAVFSSDVAA